MRSFWIKVHLYIASFFVPMLLAMAVSGGLYLLGIKGGIQQSPVEVTTSATISADSGTLSADVAELLAANGIEHEFEYVKVSGSKLFTRPTSREHYEINLSGATPTLIRNQPDFLKSLVELHKGHGPLIFKDLQKLMALGLVIILLSGFWLGISSPGLRVSTLITTVAGSILFGVAALWL
jgi:hypothetical protein